MKLDEIENIIIHYLNKQSNISFVYIFHSLLNLITSKKRNTRFFLYILQSAIVNHIILAKEKKEKKNKSNYQ